MKLPIQPHLSSIALRLALGALCLTALPAQAHDIDCKGRSGIELARCERHQKMAAKCGSITGEAHLACDREFLLANPLECKAQAGDDAKRCTAELAAVKTCEPKQAGEFMRCVRDTLKASPMGAH